MTESELRRIYGDDYMAPTDEYNKRLLDDEDFWLNCIAKVEDNQRIRKYKVLGSEINYNYKTELPTEC